MTPQLVSTRDKILQNVHDARNAGKRVGVVPTMGALHAGHLSLVETATSECDFTVVTVFVNPTQFRPGEDLARYPRDLDADLRLLAGYPVDCVFAPDEPEMYPPGFSTFVDPPDVAKPLEGQCRPTHFRGVATIVLKLFLAVPAHVAYFGQKDYQQSLVIRRMVDDLGVPISIRVCPTIREPDGLALSSRNAYLNTEERKRAIALSRSLDLAENLVAQGCRDAAHVASKMRDELAHAGITHIEYAVLVDPESLEEVTSVDKATVAAVAAHVGQTRLIDNRLIG